MVEIEGFALRAAILQDCQNYLKIKMHTINDKTRYISTIRDCEQSMTKTMMMIMMITMMSLLKITIN